MPHLSRTRVTTCLTLVLLAAAALNAVQFTALPRISKIDEKDYDMKAFATSTLSEAEFAGGALFDQRCAMCHSTTSGISRGGGPILTQETVKRRGEPYVRNMILDGIREMPGWRYTLSSADVEDVILYLKTVASVKSGAR